MPQDAGFADLDEPLLLPFTRTPQPRLSLLEADISARILCARSPSVPGWRWSLAEGRTHRTPPLPFYLDRTPQSGSCRICGLDVYTGGAHFGDVKSARASWHSVCAQAFRLWAAPNANAFGPRQRWLCAICNTDLHAGDRSPDDIEWCRGQAFSDFAQTDHIVPLYRVWRDLRGAYWTELIRYWSAENLQVLCSRCHIAKTAGEASERSHSREAGPQLTLL